MHTPQTKAQLTPFEMNQGPPLLQLMRADHLRLSKSDKRIAAYVMEQPHEVIHMSIAQLARNIGVSEPTVNRFCRKLGCDGYPDFKLKLAQEISSSGQLFVEHLEAGDNSTGVIQKIIRSIQNSVQMLAGTIDADQLTKAAETIADSNSIYFFGMGASGSVAMDAQHKFFRFGIPAVAHTDSINQRMICSMLSAKDVAVFISYTGRTKQILDNAELALDSGAKVIGITAEGSSLSNQCTHLLNVVTMEDTDLFTPMASRIAHLAVIDMLATMVALRLGESADDNILAVKKHLADTRRDDG